MNHKEVTTTTPATTPVPEFLAESPQNHPAIPLDKYEPCPSFDDEPWASRAAVVKPKSLDNYVQNLLVGSDTKDYQPLPPDHAYIKLILEFLDSVPPDCWIDEENEVD